MVAIPLKIEKRERERERERKKFENMPLSFSLKSSAKDDGSSNSASTKKTNVFATTSKKKPTTLKKNAFAAFTTTTSKKEEAPQTKRRRLDPKLPDANSSIYDFDGWKQSDEGKNQKQRRGRRLGAKRKYGVVYGGGERGGGNQDGDKKSKPKSRYVENLLVKANARKREQNIAYERAKQRELEAEIAEHGQTETFVTGAYKRKLQEDKIWMEKLEDRRREEEERDRKDRETDSRGDMTSFYRNLLTRNVALGGEEEEEDEKKKKKKIVDDVKSHARVVERTPKEESEEEVDTKKSPSTSVERPQAAVSDRPIPRTKQVEVQPPVVVSPPTKTVSPAPKISKEDRIAAARARYLARRKVKK